MAPLFSSDYKIAFEVRPDYLFVRVELPVNQYNTARQYWTEAVRMIHKRRYTRAAIEISASTALPAAEAKLLMDDFLKIIYPGIRIAIVNPHVSDEVRSSVEAAAKKRGRSMKIVDNLTLAEAWLLEDQLNFAPAALDSFVQDLTNQGAVQ